MATVKEVKLQKDGVMVTPITIIDSVKNSNGTNYKDHKHDDRYYTKTESDRLYLKSLSYEEVAYNADTNLPICNIGERYLYKVTNTSNSSLYVKTPTEGNYFCITSGSAGATTQYETDIKYLPSDNVIRAVFKSEYRYYYIERIS